MNTGIIKQVVELRIKPIDELRALYKELLPEKLNYNASKSQLISKLAYRIQELDSGGLSPDTRDRLKKIAQGGKSNTQSPPDDFKVGTKIRREWNGTIYEVEVTETGYEYQGQPFETLSPIARKITGARWNGPKFFGLRNKRRC